VRNFSTIEPGTPYSDVVLNRYVRTTERVRIFRERAGEDRSRNREP
jgi:hypothetical protein